MSAYWSPLVQSLDPYVPGEQPQDQRYIKLNTNECPYPPSPQALAAINHAAADSLRLYPDPEGTELKAAVADYYGLSADHVFVGNGSDEVLAHAFQAFSGSSDRCCIRTFPTAFIRCTPTCIRSQPR
ncbi:MAG: hypothetical protein R3E89_10430 [Thiolinea sp.]